MPFDPLPHVPVLALAFLLGGFVKGVLGLGLPTIAMGLLSLAMPPMEAAALLFVPALVTNAWQLAGSRLPALVRRLWPMLAGVALGTGAGARVIQGADANLALAGLGAVLAAYAALGLTAAPPRLAPAAERWLGPPVGLATGLVSGATGVFVIPAVPFLAALGLGKQELVQALGLSFTTSTVTLALALLGGGAFEGGVAAASVLLLAPALAGMALGRRVQSRVSEAAFRRCFLLGLLTLGLHLATQGLW
jgi:uncharacterized membrane protein YfcA